MIYKLIEDEKGNYINSEGKQFVILEASEYIDSPDGRNVGCVILNDINEAMNYYSVELIKE